jgi:hypothetical protein
VVDGDVVAIGGSVTVRGRVKGDCVAVGGTVRMEDKGVVEGDAVSVGGGVQTSDSSRIGGSNVSVGKFDFGHMNHLWPTVGAIGILSTGTWMIQTLVGLMITLFLAWISLLLLRRRIESAADHVHEHFGKSFLWGLLGWVGLVLTVPVGVIALILTCVIAIVILCITIIGIPVAILLAIAMVLAIVGLVVAVVYAAFLGYLAGALYLGRRLLGQRAAGKPLLAIGAGVVLILLLRLAGHLVGTVSFFLFHPVGMAFGFAAGLLAFIIATAGLGAILSWRFKIDSGPARGFTGASQWSSTPPPPPPAPAPKPAGPSTAPPPDGTSDAP